MEKDYILNVANDIIENEVLGRQSYGDDTVVHVNMFEVQLNGEWSLVDETVFRSWTGLRRFQGIEVHGPIYPFGDKLKVKPYTGRRTCGCPQCQEHVEPAFRPN